MNIHLSENDWGTEMQIAPRQCKYMAFCKWTLQGLCTCRSIFLMQPL